MTHILPDTPVPPRTAPEPPAGVNWFASEKVLLVRATLPPLSASQRRTAAAFAIEDRIAQPVETVNVILGPVLDGEHLVIIAARDEIAASRAERPMSKARLVPDVLALPRPAFGWAVWTGGGRALVRLADGTGFASSVSVLPLMWRHAGKPGVALCGGEVPQDIPVTSQIALPPLDPAFARLDLAIGAEVSDLLRLPRGMLALGLVLTLAAGLHLGLIWADLLADRNLLMQRKDELRAALTALGQTNTGDLDADLVAAVRAGEPTPQTGFLPLMARSSAAFGGVQGLTVHALTWADSALRFDLQAENLGELQAAEAALIAAGIKVQVGSATSGDGAAKVTMTLHGDQK